MFIGVVLSLIALGREALRHVLSSTFNPQLSSFFRLVPPYAIGSVAMFWLIQRLAAF